MKKTRQYLLVLISISLLFTACRDQAKEAVEYNDKIIAQEQLVIMKMNALDGALKTYDPTAMNKALDALKTQTSSSISTLKAMPAFDGDVAFRDAAVLYLDDLQKGIDEEMVRAVALSSLPDSSFSHEEEYELHEVCMKNIQRSERAQTKFKLAQKSFADKYKFTLKAPDVIDNSQAKP